MAGRKHGRELFRHWCARQIPLLFGFRRRYARLYFLQLAWSPDGLLLLLLRSCFRIAPDGAFSILVQVVACEVR